VIALDTNVLIEIERGEPEIAARTLAAVVKAGGGGALVVCGVVVAELCAGEGSSDTLLRFLGAARISVDSNTALNVWLEAGTAFGEYVRRRKTRGGGTSRRLAADFVIGAHACTVGTLVTSDAAFFRRAFPALRVIDPREEIAD